MYSEKYQNRFEPTHLFVGTAWAKNHFNNCLYPTSWSFPLVSPTGMASIKL
jgi:hypothetical protein